MSPCSLLPKKFLNTETDSEREYNVFSGYLLQNRKLFLFLRQNVYG